MKLNELHLPVLKRGKAGTIPFVIENGEPLMLFMKTSDPAYGGPDPMIAKGHVDKGEDAADAAIREAEEELGLKRSNIDGQPFLAWKGELSGFDAHYDFYVLAVKVKSKDDFGQFHYETESTHWLTAAEFAKVGRRSQNHIVQAAAKTIKDKMSS